MKKSQKENYIDFLKFITLSGMCWAIDLTILIILTQIFKLTPLLSNIISSLIAAAILYIASHNKIHIGRNTRKIQRLIFYMTYTSFIIYGASYVISDIEYWIRTFLISNVDGFFTITIAKILITPPQLICNFFASRFISRFSLNENSIQA